MKNGSPASRNLTYMVSVSYSSSPTFCALRDGLPNLTYMGSASYSPLPSFCTLRDGNIQFGSVLCMPTPIVIRSWWSQWWGVCHGSSSSWLFLWQRWQFVTDNLWLTVMRLLCLHVYTCSCQFLLWVLKLTECIIWKCCGGFSFFFLPATARIYALVEVQ